MGSKGRLQNVYAHKPSSIDTLVWHSISPCASTFFKSLRWTSNAMCPLGPPTTTSYLSFQFITYDARSMSQELYQYIGCLLSASQYQNISEIHTKSQEKACSLLSNNTLQTPIEQLPISHFEGRDDLELWHRSLSTQHKWRTIDIFGILMTHYSS